MSGLSQILAGEVRGPGQVITLELSAAGAAPGCAGQDVRPYPATRNIPEAIEERFETLNLKFARWG